MSISPKSTSANLLDRIIHKLERGSSPDGRWPDHNGEYWGLCPYHQDNHPGSFSVSKKGFNCFACGNRGSLPELAKKLGIDPPVNNAQSAQGLTVEAYASEKHLDLEFLRSLGLSNRAQGGVQVLNIPYLNQEGEVVATRYRSGTGDTKRFWWKKSSHLIPYGLWRLQEVLHRCTDSEGTSPYIFLVEGESDAQTLWSYGIPALGIPGAATWKPEWKDYIAGLKVYVWREPDTGGDQFVARIGQDIPEALIVSAPEGRKDISDCHISGDDISSLIVRLCAEAKPYQLSLDNQRSAEANEAYKVAESLLHSDILVEFGKLMSEMGVVGEKENVLLLYLAVTSRLIDKPVSIVVKGPSSAGKSFAVEQVLKSFPPEAYYELSGMSERALAYSQETLVHRILVIFEVVGLNSEFASYLLRSLLSEGRIRYETVESTKDGLRPRLIERDGPTGVILTTTWAGLHPENETRLLSITIRDDRDQTRAILMCQGLSAIGEVSIPPDLTKWHALQTWLSLAGTKDVVIPFAEILAEHTMTCAVRMRRDFGKVISLIRTMAILYQCQRERDAQGRIIATIEDYERVYDLLQDPISEAMGKAVCKVTRETVLAVADLLEGKANETVSETKLATKLTIDKSSVSRRVKVAIRSGYLVNLEDTPGKPAKIVLGDPLPAEDIMALPHPDTIKKIICASPSETHATLQHPDDESSPTLLVIPQPTYTISTVSLEDIANNAGYPDINHACHACGEMAWQERSPEEGGGYYCSVCHQK